MNISPFLAGYLFLVAAYLLQRNLRVQKWPSVNGTMVSEKIGTAYRATKDFRPVDKINMHTISAHISYEYTVDGHPFVGTRLAFTMIFGSLAVVPILKRQMARIGYTADGKIIVYYDPREPTTSTLLKPTRVDYALTLVPIILGGFLLWIDPIIVDF